MPAESLTTHSAADASVDELGHHGLARLVSRFPGHRRVLVKGLGAHDLVGLYWAYELACSIGDERPAAPGDRREADRATLETLIEAEIFVRLGTLMIGVGLESL